MPPPVPPLTGVVEMISRERTPTMLMVSRMFSAFTVSAWLLLRYAASLLMRAVPPIQACGLLSTVRMLTLPAMASLPPSSAALEAERT